MQHWAAAEPNSVRARAAGGANGERIALVLPDVSGGGAQRCIIELGAGLLDRGFAVDLVLSEPSGEYLAEIPDRMRVVALPKSSDIGGRLAVLRADPRGARILVPSVLLPLKASRRIRFVAGLAAYLRSSPPDAVLSAMTYTNLQTLWARRLAGVRTRVVISERTTLSESIRIGGRKENARWQHIPALVRRYYPEADAITAVSVGAAMDLAATAGLGRESITPIYNPVVSERLLRMAQEPVSHPWFADGEDVILAAGRLEAVKDFPTLLRAFARLRQRRAGKLMILGAGPQREALLQLAEQLGVGADFALPGWVSNPFAFMARARLFVLSSRYEGLPGVLIQALACGCPAVATDCPNGPREILCDGRFGMLTAVGDVEALAAAMQRAFMSVPDREALRRRGLDFSVDRAVDGYLSVLLEGAKSWSGGPHADTQPLALGA